MRTGLDPSASRARDAFRREPDLTALREAYRDLTTNPTQAVEKLQSLSDRGSVMAKLYLGYAFRTIPELINLDLSKLWYERAVQDNNLDAKFMLSNIYRNEGTFDKAVALLGEWLEDNLMGSIYLLGVRYKHGEWVEKNENTAKTLWIRAARMGHLWAQRDLSFLYMSDIKNPMLSFWGVLMWIGLIPKILYTVMVDPYCDQLTAEPQKARFMKVPMQKFEGR